MTKKYIQAGEVVDYTNGTGALIASGSAVIIGNQQIGIALVNIAIAGIGAVAKEGVFLIAKSTSNAIVQGQKLWWDDVAKQVINAPALNAYFIGFATKSELASAATVNVDIEEFNEEGPRTITLTATGTKTLNVGDFGSGDLIIFAPNTAAQTLNLPSVSAIPPGSKLFVKKTDATAAAVTIDPANSEQIAGATTYTTIATNNALAQLVSNGTAWILMQAA
jgi:predicted RecA/RadA family phage recombinase